MKIDYKELFDLANSVDLTEKFNVTPAPTLDAWEIQQPLRLDPFPPLFRPKQRPRDWWNQRGEFRPAWSHKVLYAIARLTRPWLVSEIGVGYGEQLMAMARGSYDAGNVNVSANGYDDETGRPGCLEWARECFMSARIAYNLSHSHMGQYPGGLPLSYIDLFHLDCGYSGDYMVRDLRLAIQTLSPGGIVVITSVHPATVAIQIPDALMRQNGAAVSLPDPRDHGLDVPSHPGIAIITLGHERS